MNMTPTIILISNGFKSHRDKVQIMQTTSRSISIACVSNPIGTKFKSNGLPSDDGKTIGFKSHRDKVQIHQQTLFLILYPRFKSHRDKVQILQLFGQRYPTTKFQIPQGQSSNRDVNIDRFTSSLTFQIPQGQSSNRNSPYDMDLLPSFKSHRDKVQMFSLPSFLFFSIVSNPIGTKFKWCAIACVIAIMLRFKSHRDKVQI